MVLWLTIILTLSLQIAVKSTFKLQHLAAWLLSRENLPRAPRAINDLVVVRCRYELPITATADNCLFSCYPFLAAHQTDFHIICDQQEISIQDKQIDAQDYPPGDPVFMPCVTPNRPPTIASTSATSTSFGISTSTYPESSNEATSSTYPSTPHHGDTQHGGPARGVSDGSETNGTFGLGPGVESDERRFIRNVVSAVQR